MSNHKFSAMRIIFLTVFLLMTKYSFTQTTSEKITDDNIDSLLCPSGYAAIGHPYPAFKLFAKKKAATNQSVKGKVVFINFWFEGCHPCMAEMSALNELFKSMKNHNDFVFISITTDDQEAIKRVREKYSLAFEIFALPEGECQRLNFGCGYPTSIILDKTGTVKYKHSSGSTNKEEASKFVMSTMLPEIQSLL